MKGEASKPNLNSGEFEKIDKSELTGGSGVVGATPNQELFEQVGKEPLEAEYEHIDPEEVQEEPEVLITHCDICHSEIPYLNDPTQTGEEFEVKMEHALRECDAAYKILNGEVQDSNKESILLSQLH